MIEAEQAETKEDQLRDLLLERQQVGVMQAMYDPHRDLAIMKARSGWKTTEFWTMIVSVLVVGVLLLTDSIYVDDVVKLWPLFSGVGAYAVSRGLAKQ